jgi:hypothetical protein
MNKNNLILIGIIFLLVTLGCSSMTKGRKAGEAGVEKFHKQFGDGQYSQIYSEANQKFKDVTSDAELNELLGAVHDKLGTVTKSTQTSWNVNATTGGTTVSLTYDVEYSKDAKGTEDFVFFVENDKASLLSFNIKSPQLVTR